MRTNKFTTGICALFLLGLCSVFCPLQAEDLRSFETDDQRLRYKQLTEELRCLVCQNQNLADSDAGLANDLRDELYSMLIDNKSDDEIIAFMVERYGDFVIYEPPVNITTVLLWFGPFIIVSLATLFLVMFLLRRSEESTKKPLSDKERQRLKTILNKDQSQ